MNKKKDNNISSFENDLKSLQKILEDIEKDDLSLEMMIKKYQEGVEISKKCQNICLHNVSYTHLTLPTKREV